MGWLLLSLPTADGGPAEAGTTVPAMRAGRSPLQILVLTAAVGAGILIGVELVGRRAGHEAGERERAAWPDLSIEDASPTELAKHGFRLTGREPSSWSEISVRLYQDQRGIVTLVRCRVDPGEAATLISFPVGSRRPERDEPPADWPWGTAGDPFRVPDWWRPRGGQSRCYERLDPAGLPSGIFANYDPASRLLHFWQWQRSDWTVRRTSPLEHLVADELAATVASTLRAAGQPADAAGWMHAVGLEPGACGLPAGRMPAAVTRVDAALLPVAGRHRFLLAVHGLDEDAAWRLVAEQPLRELPADGPPPVERWAHAALPASAAAGAPTVPAWFAPGPGPRRAHCLIAIGSGAVEAGRWVAYDPARRVLFVWDWEDRPPQPPAADLCPAQR
jgi:hypothetical protein